MGDKVYEHFLAFPWRDCFDVHPSPQDACLECVIVEPRPHKNLAGVLRNVSSMLPYAALTIVSSEENYDFVERIVNPNTTNVRIRAPVKGNLTLSQYNDLLTCPDFWSDMTCERTLIFQTDAGILKNNILRYMEYDYIGAPWSWKVCSDPNVVVGNGGFSLRCPKWMKHIADNFKRDAHEAEDIFYARHLTKYPGAYMPSYGIASDFSIEHNKSTDPMAFHKAYKFQKRASQLLDVGSYIHCELPKVINAWVQTGSGYCTPVDKKWLQTGISSYGGFILPTDTLIRESDKKDDEHLHILFGDSHHIDIPLKKGRTIGHWQKCRYRST
jgi:hypothetical protein